MTFLPTRAPPGSCRGGAAFFAAVPILSQLMKAEMAEREVRSIAYHMKAPVSRLTKTSPDSPPLNY
jgi:hypothetical protein